MGKGKRNGTADSMPLKGKGMSAVLRATGLAGLWLADNRRLWNDLEAMVLPPLLAGQFRVWRRGATPVACAAWALLDAPGEARLIAGGPCLAPAEWQAGDRLWLIYLLAPYGGRGRFARELRDVVFAGREVRLLAARPDGGLRVDVWPADGRGRTSRRRPVRPPGRLVDSFGHP